VTKDNIAERLETFDLNLALLIINGQVIPGTISKAVCNIIDNTGKSYTNFHIKFYLTILSVISAKFSQSAYSLDEDSGPVQLLLVLNGTSSFDITVQVFNTNTTAFGERHYKQHCY